MAMGSFELGSILFALVITLGFAGLCAWLARAKGRDAIVWGILGFFFSVLALIVLLIIPKRTKTESSHRAAKILGVLILVASASTAFGALANPGLPAIPEHSPGLAMEPANWSRIEASEQQLDSINELHGTEVEVGELLQRLDLESFQELPLGLSSALYE